MIIYIDLFCGAGGVTTGIEKARNGKRKAAKVIACVNHDPLAIKSHARNHRNVLHFTEDIRTLDLTGLKTLKNYYRAKYPDAAFALWASLECTNFSKAKGGLPRNADSRTLAEHLFRYIDELEPDYIDIENVTEFMSWGPLIAKVVKTPEGYESCLIDYVQPWQHILDENGDYIDDPENGGFKQERGPLRVVWYGVPEKRKNGKDYLTWIDAIQSRGYRFDYKIMNAADFGAYTSRERFFAQFAKEGLPIAWPKPTHSKKPEKSMFGALQPWKPVKDVLNFSDEGESIFGRKKPLVEKTLERIYAGLKKYVAGGDDTFLSKYYSGRPEGKNIPVTGPAGTITCVDSHAVVKAAFITKYLSNDAKTGVSAGADINQPAPTITTQNRLYLTQASFLTKYHGTGGSISLNTACSTLTCRDRLALIQPSWLDKNYSSGDHNHQSIEQPAGALTTNNHYALVTPAWLDKCYSGSSNHQSVDSPAGAITTKDHYSLVTPAWLDMCYSGKDNHSSIDSAAGAITVNPHHALVQCEPWIMPTNFENTGRSINQPCPTLLASRKHHYLVNPQYNSKGASVETPAPTLIAQMGKSPLSIVTVTAAGQIAIILNPEDSATMLKIKLFMAEFGIVDIKMRMLKVPELKLIQGFPKNYYLAGNQTDQKKFIGNSVCPDLAKAICEARDQALTVFQSVKVLVTKLQENEN